MSTHPLFGRSHASPCPLPAGATDRARRSSPAPRSGGTTGQDDLRSPGGGGPTDPQPALHELWGHAERHGHRHSHLVQSALGTDLSNRFGLASTFAAPRQMMSVARPSVVQRGQDPFGSHRSTEADAPCCVRQRDLRQGEQHMGPEAAVEQDPEHHTHGDDHQGRSRCRRESPSPTVRRSVGPTPRMPRRQRSPAAGVGWSSGSSLWPSRAPRGLPRRRMQGAGSRAMSAQAFVARRRNAIVPAPRAAMMSRAITRPTAEPPPPSSPERSRDEASSPVTVPSSASSPPSSPSSSPGTSVVVDAGPVAVVGATGAVVGAPGAG